MKRFTMFACLALALVFAMSSFAGNEMPRYTDGSNFNMPSTSDGAKASRDTFIMIGPWGSGAAANGQFEDMGGLPAWNGWTHYDITQPTTTHWQISDYFADNLGMNPVVGNLAAWCGDINIVACTEEDPEGGYGDSWNDLIEWRATVANPAIGVDVHFTAYANIDSEPGYDGTEVVYFDADGRVAAVYYDGYLPNELIDVSFSLSAGDYQGTNSDEVVVQVQFQSDGGWSDADCLWPTAGAVQIDDITVTLNQGSGDVSSFTDFEDGFGDWAIAFPVGVGDFTKIWTNLEDIDPCASNFGPQVAFIDDGLVVPGAGPSLCVDWCYGPGGYIVNTTGGLAGPDAHLHIALESPVIEWPAPDADGCFLQFDVYRHEDLSADAPGMFYVWAVRSTTSENPDDIQIEGWANRNFVQYGGPDYLRQGEIVTDLMEQGRTYTQVQLKCYELGYAWDWVGNDGYPAPYFDNVRYIAYPFFGPGMAGRDIDWANDNFPAIGEVDLINLENNSVRFDMANTPSLAADLVNIPGDSIVFDITPVRAGAEFTEDPSIVVAMKANPIFDTYRVLPAGFTQNGDLVEGRMFGVPAANAAGPVAGKWAFDLPDSDFFFPGDVIHYYIEATDTDGVEAQTATLPASDPGEIPDGFYDFSKALSYNSSYTVRALPTVFEDPNNPGSLITPKTLFWNDFANRGGEAEWHGAFANLGLSIGRGYDTYYTNGPSSGVGNGLGGRATHLSLVDYDAIVYTSGDLSVNTIANGDFNNDPSNDVEVLDSWMRLGNKDMYLTGDDLVSDMIINSGAATTQFVGDWMKVSYIGNDLRPLINNQATPLVKAMIGNGVFADTDEWVAYGGCGVINTFDAVEADGASGGVALAEFTDPNGASGAYNYSAATTYTDGDTGSRTIYMPYDFMYIYTATSGDKANAALPARAVVLEQVLGTFGIEGDPLDVTPVLPGLEKFAIRNFPNPFNPTTKIEYTMPKSGHLSLKIYNVRGELVKTLIDDQIETSGHIMWDGTNDSGAKVSSGVYFSEARTNGQVQVNKMALVK